MAKLDALLIAVEQWQQRARQAEQQLEAERRWREHTATLLLALSGVELVVVRAPTKVLIRKLLADQPKEGR